MTATVLPDHAGVIVVGGGIVGASIAYHLTRAGVSDVVVLERHQLTGLGRSDWTPRTQVTKSGAFTAIGERRALGPTGTTCETNVSPT